MNRRHFCLLLCAFPTAILAAEPAGGPALPENDVETVYDNGMFRGKFRFAVPVAQRLAWEVLTDFDHMAEFVPNVEKSRILGREGNNVRVAQQGKVPFGPFAFHFESERLIDMREAEGLILAKAVAGTTKHMQSEMRVQGDGATAVLNYRVEMIPDRWLPSSLGVSFLRRELASQFTAIAREMVRRQQERQRTS